MTFATIARNFSPAWFAAVMGTAVIPLALANGSFPFRDGVAAAFTGLAILLFLAALVPWTVKCLCYREEVEKDLAHPVTAHFYPTLPIALIILALDFLRYPEMFFTAEASRSLAFVLWILGALGIYLCGFVILSRVFCQEGIAAAQANFGWLIPPVAKVIIPVAGIELAELFPGSLELTLGLSLVSFGVGFFLFLFVGAAVFARYIYQPLPPSQLAPTFFVGMVPTAITATILLKLMHLCERLPILGIDPQSFASFAKIALLGCWGFSLWWFVMACLLMVRYLRTGPFPYAMSWWAFTFPTGALCLASAAAWQVTGFAWIFFFTRLATFFLLAVWALVFAKTIQGVASGKIFLPAHGPAPGLQPPAPPGCEGRAGARGDRG